MLLYLSGYPETIEIGNKKPVTHKLCMSVWEKASQNAMYRHKVKTAIGIGRHQEIGSRSVCMGPESPAITCMRAGACVRATLPIC